MLKSQCTSLSPILAVSPYYVDPAHIITGYIYHNILLEGSKGACVNSFVFTCAYSLEWRDVIQSQPACVRPSPPLSNKHAIQSLITIAYHADMNIIPAGNEQCLNHTKFCDFAMLYELSSLMDTCISFIVESALSLSS